MIQYIMIIYSLKKLAKESLVKFEKFDQDPWVKFLL